MTTQPTLYRLDRLILDDKHTRAELVLETHSQALAQSYAEALTDAATRITTDDGRVVARYVMGERLY